MAYLRPYRGLEERLEALVFLINFYNYEELPMFNNTNVRFSNTAQVARTVKFLKENKTTKTVQYTPAFKIKVVDLMLEEKVSAEQGKDTFINKDLGTNGKLFGKFSKIKFFKACGLSGVYASWEAIYDQLEGDSTLNGNVCAVSRHGLAALTRGAESQGLGELAKESSALVRKTRELSLKHNAKEMGYKLVKIA